MSFVRRLMTFMHKVFLDVDSSLMHIALGMARIGYGDKEISESLKEALAALYGEPEVSEEIFYDPDENDDALDGYWSMSSTSFMRALRAVHEGASPEMVYMEMYANSDIEQVTGDDEDDE